MMCVINFSLEKKTLLTECSSCHQGERTSVQNSIELQWQLATLHQLDSEVQFLLTEFGGPQVQRCNYYMAPWA